MSELPIGCSLDGQDLAQRMEAWGALFQRALLEREPTTGGFALHFRREDGIEGELSRLSDLEAECCGELRFRIRTGPESVSMHVEGPWESTPWRMAMQGSAKTG